MSSTEQLIQIRSARAPGGDLYLRDAQFVTGQGTIVFSEGRAEVPRAIYELIKGNPQIELDGNQVGPVVLADGGRGLPDGLVDASDDELDFLADMLNLLRSSPAWHSQEARGDLLEGFALAVRAASDDPPIPTPDPGPSPQEPLSASQGDPSPEDVDGDDDAPAAPPNPPEDDEQIRAAKEHLASEGEHVPKSIPQGFEPMTGEGEPRCYAAKTDGSQCANAAKTTEHDGETVSTYACGLATHKAQVAQLP